LGKAINDRDRTELSQCPRLHDANLVTPWRVARPNFPPSHERFDQILLEEHTSWWFEYRERREE
jgi:hypothetical protein